jgi:hypothetical protein
VHQPFFVGPAEQRFGFRFGQTPALAPIQGRQGSLIKPDTGLDRPAAILAQPATIAGLDHDVVGCLDHLLYFL